MARRTLGRMSVKLAVRTLPFIGVLFISNAIWVSVHGIPLYLIARMAEIGLIGLAFSRSSVLLPSGASWRLGMPLMMVSIFVVPPALTVLVPIPGLIVITFLARGKLWKYLQTIAHVGSGLYISGWVYHGLLTLLHLLPGERAVAMLCALCVHLIVNRVISAAIVADRTGRSFLEEARLVTRELHWGYMNSYLIVFLAMISQEYVDVSIFVAAILQFGVRLAVDGYSKFETLRHSLWRDGLTSTENRAAWEEFVKDSKGSISKGTLLVIDFDGFKRINDSLGHLVGDQILVELTHTLKTTLPKDTRIFRYGGDEFACFTHENLVGDLRSIINVQLNDVVKAFGHPGLTASVSVGTAQAPNDSNDLIQMFQVADSRMYQQKRQENLMTTGMEIGLPESILAFVVAIESRDVYTAGHSARVAFYALKLAEYLGITSDERQSLFRSGLVHDVGKIGIPDSILNKTGRLTDAERRVIEGHPDLGFQMCAKMGFAKIELELIRHHHERWDGLGYPANLKGEEIPFLARILSVADVFDALTSARSYRPAWDVESAMDFIDKHAGSMFDPVCAKSWVALNQRSLLINEYSNWVRKSSLHSLVPSTDLEVSRA